MASTQQFALEYLQNGRRSLETHLQNPSMVTEHLRDLNIIPEKVVRMVRSYKKRSSQTKVLLSEVTKRGEVASYELLKILYENRHKTLPRTQSKLGPDLHHWISCFSFTEDPDLQSSPASDLGPCERYRKQLKMKATEVVQAKLDRSMNFLRERKWKAFTYIPLVLDTEKSDSLYSKIKFKGYKKTREKKLKIYIPRDKGKLSLDHLLKTNEKNILLVGKPGIGKTTVVEQLLRLWSENEHSEESSMFYFDEPAMRSISHSSEPSTLRSLLFDKYVSPKRGTEDEVLRDLEKNSENVTVVFDGVIEWMSNAVLKGIMNKEILCDAKVLTTCRPEAEECEFLTNWPSYRVEVKGFNDESIQAYFKWRLGTTEPKECSILNNLAVFSLCHVPLYAFIVTACISFSPCEADLHPCTITEMYVRIFRHCMKIHGDQNVEHLDKYIQDHKGNIRFIASSSYQAMLEKSVNLSGLDCKDNIQQAFLTFSAAQRPTTEFLSSSFLHNTMQEFWAALFLLMTPKNICDVLQKCKTEDGKYLKYVVCFLCGLMSSHLADLMNCVVHAEEIGDISDSYMEKIIDTFVYPSRDEDYDRSSALVSSENLLFTCQCLFEHQSPKACASFLQKVNFVFNLSGEELDPQQCCAVSYVINQSECQVVCLYLDNCSISDRGLKLFLSSLGNIAHLSLDPVIQCQMWKVALHPDTQADFDRLLRLCNGELHLSAVEGQTDQGVFQRAGEFLKQKGAETVELCLHLDQDTPHIAESLEKGILDSLPNINVIRFVDSGDRSNSFEAWERSFQLDLLLRGALQQEETGQKCVDHLRRVLPVTNSHSIIKTKKEKNKTTFALLLYQHVKSYENRKGVTVLPELLPVFESVPPVWQISLVDSNNSALLDVLKVTGVKKPLEVGLSDDDTELGRLLVFLPFISQLRFNDDILIQYSDPLSKTIKRLLNLFRLAKQHEDQTGEQTLKILSDVCSYPNFPFDCGNMQQEQTTFLLDLYSSAAEFQFEPKVPIISAIQTILLSAPAVWVTNMCGEEGSVLLTVLKLTRQKRSVYLKDWSVNWTDENIKQFIQYLPHISRLWVSPQDEIEGQASHLPLSAVQRSCIRHLCVYSALDDKETGQPSLQALLTALHSAYSSELSAPQFLQDLCAKLCCEEQVIFSLCEILCSSRELNTQLAVSLLQAVNFNVTLNGWLTTESCRALGSLLGSENVVPDGQRLNMTLTPESVSIEGAQLLFKQVKEIHTLRTNNISILTLARLIKSKSFSNRLIIEELVLVFHCPSSTKRVQGRLLSSLVSLLSVWRVKILNLRDCPLEGDFLTALLCLKVPQTIRLNQETLQKLSLMVFEAQDKELTQYFLEKVNQDLSDSLLDWKVLLYLLATTTNPISVNLKKIRAEPGDLLPFFSNARFQRVNGPFTRTVLRAVYQQRAGHLVIPFLTSTHQWINLSNLTLDVEDCDALRFALDYSDGVKLNLLWTRIPLEKMEILLKTFTLHRITELRVDRRLLLDLLHAVARIRTMTDVAAAILAVLQHKLDLSCSSSMDLTVEEDKLHLCSRDCNILCSAIEDSKTNTVIELNITDCVVEDAELEKLCFVSHNVRLSMGKSTLLRLLHLVVGRRDKLTIPLLNALGGKVDLSHTPLVLRDCSSLALVLDSSKDLSELDLSHCGLRDEHLDLLFPHLHKAEVLSLHDNPITKEGFAKLNMYMMGLLQTVNLLSDKSDHEELSDSQECLTQVKMESFTALTTTTEEFAPSISNMSYRVNGPFTRTVLRAVYQQRGNKSPFTALPTTTEEFAPSISNMSYRYTCPSAGHFRCRDTGLVFGMWGEGSVEYNPEHWDERILTNSGYEPAGPLYRISSPETLMYRLDLPHCETNVYAAENLRVLHESREQREFLQPQTVTQQHVCVTIHGLSRFSLVRKKKFSNQRVKGQVLFFLEPKVTPCQNRLWVFLIPRNVPFLQVEESNKKYTSIKTSSNCIFRPKAKYTVMSDLPHALELQPKNCTFLNDYSASQHPSFELFLSLGISELYLMIVEKTKLKMFRRWCRRLILKASSASDNNVSSEGEQGLRWINALRKIIEQLTRKEKKKLKGLMKSLENHDSIPESSLEEAKDAASLARLMVKTWGPGESILVTKELMGNLPRNDQAVTSLLNPFLVPA